MMLQNRKKKNPDVSETLFSLCFSQSSLMAFQYQDQVFLFHKQPCSLQSGGYIVLAHF